MATATSLDVTFVGAIGTGGLRFLDSDSAPNRGTFIGTTVAPSTTTTPLPPVLAQGSGSGDDVFQIDIPNTPAVVTFPHTGSGNFAVWSLDQNVENIDLCTSFTCHPTIGVPPNSAILRSAVDRPS